jgi:hypothetical protein
MRINMGIELVLFVSPLHKYPNFLCKLFVSQLFKHVIISRQCAENALS